MLGQFAIIQQRKGVSLMKRPQGPIEIPPSVQNPQEGRSRSLKVTFQRGKSKKKRWEKSRTNKLREREPVEATLL